MKMKEEYKWAMVAFVLGILICHFTAFMNVFQYPTTADKQPHDFNCNRAATLCNFSISGGGGIDNTPYADCDSCCPDEPTNTCDGVMTPYVGTSDGIAAANFCDQFTCPAINGEPCTCGATYISQIAMLGWQCTCDTR